MDNGQFLEEVKAVLNKKMAEDGQIPLNDIYEALGLGAQYYTDENAYLDKDGVHYGRVKEEYIEFPLTGTAEPVKIEFGYTMSNLKWIYTYPNGYCASIVLLGNGFFSVAAYLKESDTISHRFVDEHGSSEDDIRFDQVAEILDEIARYPEVI